ncbi:MAG: hypothetical protein RL141_851 [Candidatus Parcubacteria bacterium]|jgi:hypothetical protein
MQMRDFPNPKLNLPKEFKDSTDAHMNRSLDAVASYLESIGHYIYTDIDLNYTVADPKHIHTWIQRLISANLLRSLYLRNAFVEMFNSRNTTGIYLPLKAWFETAALLASILDLLSKDLNADELHKKLEPFMLGNRGKGTLRVGEVDSVNVQTMIEKGDEYLEKMAKRDARIKSDSGLDKFFTNYYDVASNPTHPSFDAHEIVGGIQEGGIWHAKDSNEIRRDVVERYRHYAGLLLTPMFVKSLCEKLFEIEGKYFDTLKNPRYFEAA